MVALELVVSAKCFHYLINFVSPHKSFGACTGIRLEYWKGPIMSHSQFTDTHTLVPIVIPMTRALTNNNNYVFKDANDRSG